jgi:hypothetical protein
MENTKQTKPTDYTKTESMIHDMLVENTGVSIFDSGGTYGRAWQRNRRIADFRTQQRITVKHDGEYLLIIKDLFHFLTENLEYDQAMDQKFQRFRRARKDNYDITIMEEFSKQHHNAQDPKEPISDNSYNHEHILSQDIQFSIFIHNGTEYIILQIHGGADIRGGYTKPRVFRIYDWMQFMVQMIDILADCECKHVDSDDTGYNWYGDAEDKNLPRAWVWKNDHFECQDCGSVVRFV